MKYVSAIIITIISFVVGFGSGQLFEKQPETIKEACSIGAVPEKIIPLSETLPEVIDVACEEKYDARLIINRCTSKIDMYNISTGELIWHDDDY